MRDRAILAHHPYESFSTSTEAFIEQAADDPRVQSIKMTLYRAGGDSPIIRALIRAAERGVQVAVLVELKARFDEATNVSWAKQLERAGVHVVYGMVGLRRTRSACWWCATTATSCAATATSAPATTTPRRRALYEDLGILTSDPETGADVAKLFNHLTGYSRDDQYHTLVVAPTDLRPRILELIEREAPSAPDGRITIKANSIADGEMIERPVRAPARPAHGSTWSIRGICCLRAGCPRAVRHIQVRSILGRYLEHSRIYRFAHGEVDGSATYLIGSADLMPRNLDRRVEVLVPIVHPKHQEWLDTVLGMLLADDIVRWELLADDAWVRCGPLDAFEPHAQSRMYRWVVERQQSKRTS